jgi:hypothetical protein
VKDVRRDMYKLMVEAPVIVVLASISFNVFYFLMALQMGRVSHNSIMWIVGQLPTILPAMRGDLLPFFEARQLLAAATC